MEKIPNGSEKWLWPGRGLQLKIEIGLYKYQFWVSQRNSYNYIVPRLQNRGVVRQCTGSVNQTWLFQIWQFPKNNLSKWSHNFDPFFQRRKLFWTQIVQLKGQVQQKITIETQFCIFIKKESHWCMYWTHYFCSLR